MRLLVSFAALFLSVVLLQMGLGGLAPLDALSGAALGFSPTAIGALGSAHFLGFFIGCWWAPRLMGEVGHSRAFAALTAAGAIGCLLHMMVTDPFAWMVMRVAVGVAVAGCYTIIEAWLQAKVTNATRGRAMGVYRVVDIVGNLGAQLLIGFLEPAAYLSYNLLALFCCAALFPLVLTRAEAPETGPAPRLQPLMAWRMSPLASAGVVVSGITGAAFRMVGPLYGLAVGLPAEQIALFLAAYVLGGAFAQIPVGWMADTYDRRSVLIWLSVASTLACGLTVAGAQGGVVAIFLAAGFFGMTTFPIYSVSAAHAHDFAQQSERVELSAALLFLYAVGAIASPLIAAALIALFGPPGMFAFIAIAHVLLVVFGLIRMRARPSPRERTAYTYVPRTSYLIGRLLRRDRD
jgi:MFS family permease